MLAITMGRETSTLKKTKEWRQIYLVIIKGTTSAWNRKVIIVEQNSLSNSSILKSFIHALMGD